MKITKINIKKFRKLENVVVEDLGLINELYGSNGSGKTSFISFITWLIWGETLDYGKNDDMNIDTYNPNELISGEITLKDNDVEMVLAREFGYNEKGNKVQSFFVNGRKVKTQNEYYDEINDCFKLRNDISNLKIKNFNLYRALSDPYYLPNNENQFRELIASILDIDTNYVLFQNEKYSSIKQDYYNQGKNYDNCKDFYNQQLRTIEKDLLSTNTLLEESKKVEFSQEEYDALLNELNGLRSYNFETNQELTNKINELNDLQLKLIESREKDYQNRPLSNEEVEVNKLKNEYNELCEDYNKKFSNNRMNKVRIKSLKETLDLYNKKVEELRNSTFKEVRCPNCDTLLNEKDYREFNKKKVEDMKEYKHLIEVKEQEINDLKIIDLSEMETQLKELLDKIKGLQEIVSNQPKIYSSDETKSLETTLNDLKQEIELLQQSDNEKKQEIIERNNARSLEITNKLGELEINKAKLNNAKIYKQNKSVLLDNKSTYELRLSLLNEFKVNEINLIKEKTSEIFGNDFEFEMLVKNKSNDNYKKVCYASIDGLEHNKSNTAKYLKYSILLLEKLKAYIGGCDLPIVFDIADNIGKKTRNEIFELVKNSQVFYTRISDEDNVERKLNIIK